MLQLRPWSLAVNILDIFRNYDMINKIKYKKL